jgi:putative (di)nucleoside polyphosphate hydrolase
MSADEIKLKPNVAAILRRADGRILICERLGMPGAWQFPQGGIDDDETPEQALKRELWEEIGVEAMDYEVLHSRGPYRYVFPDGKKKRGHHGKEQIYFMCDFRAPDSHINIATEHPEFQAFRWIAPDEFRIAWLPEMKHEVYRAVFADFFNVTIT